MSKSPITCHVLDAALGKPATDVEVSLIEVRIDGQDDKSIRVLSTGKTNADGRCTNLIAPEASLSTGVYKMLFNTGQYFAGRGVNSFYPYVEITFSYTNPTEHYHIPLLLSPHSYTTYRGS